MSLAPLTSSSSSDLRFPPLPKTLLRALELMRAPSGPTIDDTIHMVEQDPAVITRLLKMVNSAAYGQRTQIVDIRRAVVALGPVRITSLVMSMNLHDIQESLEGHSVALYLDLVRHSVATGFMARTVVMQDPTETQSVSFGWSSYTAGLLHDLGKMLLLYNDPDTALHLYREVPEETADPLDAAAWRAAEVEHFGQDHITANERLMDHMGVNDTLGHVVKAHHDPSQFNGTESTHRDMAYVVAAGNLLANTYGYAMNHVEDRDVYAEHPLWETLLEKKVVGYPSVDALIDAMEGQEEALGVYVNSIA